MARILNAEKPCRAARKTAAKRRSKETRWFMRASAAALGVKPMVRPPMADEERT